MTDVFVHRTPLRDIYVAFQSVSPSEDGTFSATVLVKEVPAMGMLWGGMYLMAAGVVLRPLERLRPRPGRGGGPEDAGHEGSEEENGWE